MTTLFKGTGDKTSDKGRLMLPGVYPGVLALFDFSNPLCNSSNLEPGSLPNGAVFKNLVPGGRDAVVVGAANQLTFDGAAIHSRNVDSVNTQYVDFGVYDEFEDDNLDFAVAIWATQGSSPVAASAYQRIFGLANSASDYTFLFDSGLGNVAARGGVVDTTGMVAFGNAADTREMLGLTRTRTTGNVWRSGLRGSALSPVITAADMSATSVRLFNTGRPKVAVDRIAIISLTDAGISDDQAIAREFAAGL